MTGIGSHQSAKAITTTWLTPPHVIDALGGWQSFDLDPCAAPAPQPWRTAKLMVTEDMADGLSIDWFGRVFLNFPYDDPTPWLRKMAAHNGGTMLMFARTDREDVHEHMWSTASGILFLRGRLHFHYPDGTRAKHNGGAPSILCAYGPEELDRLAAVTLPGHFQPLRFARFVLVAGLDQSWSELMRDWIGKQHGPVSVGDAYRAFARHPKAQRNQHWRAKVRQKLAAVGRRVERNQYVRAA
jgi:hypothetical protein